MSICIYVKKVKPIVSQNLVAKSWMFFENEDNCVNLQWLWLIRFRGGPRNVYS